MEYIKKFESFNISIEDICEKYGIENYTINQDGSIDVDGDVNLTNRGLKKLPLKFGKVSGNFYCSFNQLISLEGTPDRIGGNFHCYNNKLTNLKGSPKEVGGHFYCEYNQLVSLEGSPSEVGNFHCDNNQLVSLEGSPSEVGGNFYCDNNQLVSLEGSPDRIDGNFDCSYNKLTSLEGSPDRIGGVFVCDDNPVHNIYKLFEDKSNIELFNDYDIIRDNGKSIVLDRLNAFLEDIGKPTVTKVKGYNNI